jgi:hypothetical protein
MMKFTPEVISVLDYTKGFGHSDLVNITRDDLSLRSNWRTVAYK